MNIDVRIERDSLGEIPVPRHAYYGAHAARAIDNFPISGMTIGQFPALIRALALIKKVAAQTNAELCHLSPTAAQAIIAACDEIAAGAFASEFAVDVFQGGAGTSTNMNANEVIANRALEILGASRGDYKLVHPNNDVNRSQSTNDVYPSAIRVALLLDSQHLFKAVDVLSDVFEAKGVEFANIVKLGRTQLQDAVPMTLGQEFMAFANSLREEIRRLHDASKYLTQINLGGTAIGTGINTDPRYQALVTSKLANLTGLALSSAEDLIEASWDASELVFFSGALKSLALKLSKIANDLRLLSSGPRSGLGEIVLPAVQAGSSIMPGKINPVIPELVNQVAFQVAGSDLVVTLAAEAGQLQLNAMEPVMAYNLLQAISLLTNATTVFATKCAMGIEASVDRCGQHVRSSSAIATALVPFVGYDRASELAKQILNGSNVSDVLSKEPGLTPDALKLFISPASR